MPAAATYSVWEQGYSQEEMSGVATPGSRGKMGSKLKILNEKV
jgi:hypothetical protein